MKKLLLILLLVPSSSLRSQNNELEAHNKNQIKYYHLSIDIDPVKKFISGNCAINCNIKNFTDSLSLALTSNYKVIKVINNNHPVSYYRKNNNIKICLNGLNRKSANHTIIIYYEGIPKISKRPPWDDGFVWVKDSTGNPFTGVVCELEGAGIWWPSAIDIGNKPDSLLFSITVPKGLCAISNGILQSTDTLQNKVCFNWFNPLPIINYNLTFYLGNYFYFNKKFFSNHKSFELSYYSLNNKVSKAEMYFNQIDTVLTVFEKYFGQFPFNDIGYKLVDAPYAGMEHQTAIAIAKENGSIFQLLGFKTNIGYVLVHETAHEWWGNSVSIKSLTDLWINESFATYSESLFIEYLFGKEKAVEYINQDLEHLISNEIPVYDSSKVTYNHDIYLKGSAVWNTFRSVVKNDSALFGFLHSVQKEYRYKSISTPELLHNINKYFKCDYSYFFNQYIFSNNIPQLEIQKDRNNSNQFQIRWSNCVQEFRMPLFFNNNDKIILIDATTDLKTFTIKNFNIEKEHKRLQNDYLIKIKIIDF